jgi:hypothetical protein
MMKAARLLRLWWLGVALMLAMMTPKLVQHLLSIPPDRPVSPLDNTRPELASQWQFVEAAVKHVPAGESLTIRACNTDDELTLYMMALGLAAAANPQPSSYYGTPTPEVGGRARFVLEFGGCGIEEEQVTEVARVPGGRIYRRW